jgi:hypothetical protein
MCICDGEEEDDRPLTTYRIGTPEEAHRMSVEMLRDTLDHIMSTFESSGDAPIPMISFLDHLFDTRNAG